MTGIFTRRTMTAGAAFFAAVLSFGVRPKTAETAILATLSDQEAARRVGRSASWPTMQDRQILLTQILGDLGMGADQTAQTSTGEIRKRLAQRIQTDYAIHRTVKLDGWLLTMTEARLCALAALAA